MALYDKEYDEDKPQALDGSIELGARALQRWTELWGSLYLEHKIIYKEVKNARPAPGAGAQDIFGKNFEVLPWALRLAQERAYKRACLVI